MSGPASVAIDVSAFEMAADKLLALIASDPRRACEAGPAYAKLKAEDALTVPHPSGAAIYCIPHPRFLALYESLRLRHRLDLPTMDPPNV